jgi:hypothetical protein
MRLRLLKGIDTHLLNGCRTAGMLLGLAMPAFSNPTASYAALNHPSISVTGIAEVVFDYQSQRCDNVDIPDSPLRAYRSVNGSVVAFSTHYLNRRFVGDSLAKLSRVCDVVYQGQHLADPSKFNDRTWIASTWTEDGKEVWALGHNEYQAENFQGKCAFTSYTECCYNTIVLLTSRNGGKGFARADAVRPMPIAAPPFKNDFDQGHSRGYYDPSNIIFFNGYYYVLIAQRGMGENRYVGRCLFRTTDPSRIDAWQFMTGGKYISSARSAYLDEQQHTLCDPVEGLSGTVGSIAKIRNTNLFAAFAIEADSSADGGALDVFYSGDLVHWEGKQTVMRLSAFWSRACGNGWRYNYASVLDDSDNGRNFEEIGDRPWLFIVRAACNITMNRDLVRIPLHVATVESK